MGLITSLIPKFDQRSTALLLGRIDFDVEIYTESNKDYET